MSRLAKDYIERNFKLSRAVGTVESDLANGFVLAEISHQSGFLSDDAREHVKDDLSPSVIVKNFKILAEALGSVGIQLTNNDIAQIISEQSGAAAGVVLKIKHIRDNAGKKVEIKTFRDSMKSLRPKPFVRTSATIRALDPEQTDLHHTQHVLSDGTFNDIHFTLLSNDYRIHKYSTKAQVEQEIREEEMLATQRRDSRRQQFLAKTKSAMDANRTATAILNEKWAQTQKVKFDRQVRDVQFDMATMKIAELKKKNAARTHDKEQMDGIDSFEKNLIRNGIGGNDDDGALSTTYEDGEGFLNRMEELARKQWPSNEDIGNFMSQLKDRTKEKRIARYEKARRRRRMQVDQSAMGGDDDDIDALDLHNDQDDIQLEQQRSKALAKEAKLKEIADSSKIAMDTIQQAADEKFEEFAQEVRRRCDETGERELALKAVVQARDEKKSARRKINWDVCRNFVSEIVTRAFDQVDGDLNDTLVEELNVSPLALSERALKQSKDRLNGGLLLPTPRLFDSEVWLPFVALAVNVGRWIPEPLPHVPRNGNTTVNLPREFETTEATPEPSPVQVQHYRSKRAPPTPSDIILDTTALLLKGLTSSPSGGNTSALALTPEEANSLSVRVSQASTCILLLCGGSVKVNLKAMLDMTTALLSPLATSTWSALRAINMGQKLKPLMEGKAPALSFRDLVDVVGGGKWSCSDGIASLPSPAQLLNTIADVVESSSRIISTLSMVNTEKFSPAALPFTIQSFAILMGQCLWIRGYVAQKLKAQSEWTLEMDEVVLVCLQDKSQYPICLSSTNEAVFVRVLDWFMRGNSKESIPTSDAELLQAVQTETGSAKPAPKKAVKPAKGEQDLLFDVSLISDIVWMISLEVYEPLEVKDIAGSSDDAACTVMDALAKASYEGVSQSDPSITLDAITQKETSLVQLSANALFAQTSFSLLEFAGSLGSSVSRASLSSVPYFKFREQNSVPEMLIATLLRQVAATSTDVSVLESHVKSVLATIDLRRARLKPADMLLLLHSMGERPLDITRLNDTFAAALLAKAKTIESVGLHLMGVLSVVKHGERSISGQESKFINVLKAPDNKWKDLCQRADAAIRNFHSGTSSLIKTTAALANQQKGIETCLRDLICRVGDVIDERHMKWLDLSGVIELETIASINAAFRLWQETLQVTAKALLHVLEAKLEAGSSLANTLTSSGYLELPFVVSSESQGEREQSLTDKRALVVQLKTLLAEKFNFGLQPSRSSSTSSLRSSTSRSASSGSILPPTNGSAWDKIAEFNLASIADSSIGIPIAQSIFNEVLDTVIVILSSSLKSLDILETDIHAMIARLQVFTRLRYSYEHKVLQEWSVELKRSYLDANCADSERFMLSRYHFGVSQDAHFDGIPLLHNHGLIQTGNLRIPIVDLYSLVDVLITNLSSAELIIALKHELANALTDDNANLQKMPPAVTADESEDTSHIALLSSKPIPLIELAVRLLQSGAQVVIQSGKNLPPSWTDAVRLRSLLLALPCKSLLDVDIRDSDASIIATMTKTVIKRICECLIFSEVPSYPSTQYLSRIGRVFASVECDVEGPNMLFRPDLRPSLERFVGIFMANNKLKCGWWKGATIDAVFNSIRSIALCCLDDQSKVIVEDVIRSLAQTSSMLASTHHEAFVLMKPSNPQVSSQDGNGLENLSTPSFMRNSFFRLAKLCGGITVDFGEEIAGDVFYKQAYLASDAYLKYQGVVGCRVAHGEIPWLTNGLLAGGAYESQALKYVHLMRDITWFEAKESSAGLQPPATSCDTVVSDGIAVAESGVVDEVAVQANEPATTAAAPRDVSPIVVAHVQAADVVDLVSEISDVDNMALDSITLPLAL